MRNRRLIVALGLLVPLILTACGGSNKPATSIRVTMTDFMFSPNAFTVPAGQQITLDASNGGAVDHSFIIMKLGHEVSGHFTPDDQANVFWEQKLVGAGQSAQATFTAPSEAGVYQVLCGNAGHFEAGMVAKLVVVSP